jgi:Flp pilus assembly protein TadG
MRNPLRNERGAVFLLVGLALTLLAAVIGFATDYGVLSYTRNQGQAAADAAALAGASGIPQYVDDADDSLIHERIAALDEANDVRGFAADLGEGGATVDLLHWEQATNEFTCENDGCEQELVNAVRVTKSGYETPMYFSWARNLLGGDDTGTKTINVSAVAHKPCPDTFEPPPGGPGWGPIALRECKIGFPEACHVTSIIQTDEGADNSAFTTFNLNGSNVCGDIVEGKLPAALDAEIEVGDEINLVGTGAAVSCLKKLDDRYEDCGPEDCTTDPIADPPTSECHAVLPVIDCAGSESLGIVKGFALVCFTNITSPPKKKLIETQVICPYEGGEGTGGTCLGTLSQQAVLIR